MDNARYGDMKVLLECFLGVLFYRLRLSDGVR